MKNCSHKSLLVVTLLALFIGQYSTQAQTASEPSKAKAWFTSRTWLNGLQSSPADAINYEEFAKQYQANKAAWDKAFAFLRDTDFTKLRVGKYPIDDEVVFATITEGPPREISNVKWEAHQNYNDIHFVVKGKEKIGIMPVANAQVVEAYNATKDIGFYKIDNGQFYLAEPGVFYIATTKDAHNPSNKVEGIEGIKKVVVKVRNAP